MEKAGKSLQTNKDQFYLKLIGEAAEISKKQAQVFKDEKGKVEIVDKSLSNTIEYYIRLNNDKSDEEARSIKRTLNLPE